MTIITQTVLYSCTKLEVMITLARRDKSAFDAYYVFENCN